MTVKFYNITYTKLPVDAPSWERELIDKITDGDGKEVSQLEFIWLKDPKIPLIVYQTYDSGLSGSYQPSFKNGMGHIRKWISVNVDDDEDVHIFYDNFRFSILFETKETIVAYKLRFGGDDEEHHLSWVEMTTLFD